MKSYFTKTEWFLWLSSAFLILASFFIFDRESYLTLSASLIGVTSLIFSAKGNPVGQLLIVVFSLIYGVISYQTRYYGEMITYLGMTMPMAVIALLAWIKNPYEGKKSEVKVNSVSGKEMLFAFFASLSVTLLFYFILKAFHTAHLLLSTLSVTTSFLAVYLTARRSPFFALAYACNDVVLILLWSLAAVQEQCNLSVVVCFLAFLVNDLYGFYNWRKLKHRQRVAS